MAAIAAGIHEAWDDTLTATTGINRVKSPTNEWTVAYERWFGSPHTEGGKKTVYDTLFYMVRKVRFIDFIFDCRTRERATVPAKLCNYTLQPWDCYSVTDTFSWSVPDSREIAVYQGFWDISKDAQIKLLLRIAASRSPYHMRFDVVGGDARRLALSGSRDVFFNFYNYWAFIQNRRDPLAAPTDHR